MGSKMNLSMIALGQQRGLGRRSTLMGTCTAPLLHKHWMHNGGFLLVEMQLELLDALYSVLSNSILSL